MSEQKNFVFVSCFDFFQTSIYAGKFSTIIHSRWVLCIQNRGSFRFKSSGIEGHSGFIGTNGRLHVIAGKIAHEIENVFPYAALESTEIFIIFEELAELS